MNDDIESVRAENDRLQRELDTHREAHTTTWNTTVHPLQMERARAETKARVDAAIKERQARDADAAQAREARRLAEGRQRLEDYEGQSHQRWLANGGTESDWHAAWPRMKQDWLVAQSATDPRERAVAAEMAKRSRTGERFA